MMAEPFIGEIRLFSFGQVPQGWAICDGSLLSINQYQALFSLLGITYGGDGRTTFALPDLRGRVPVHRGPSLGNTGTYKGGESVVLTTAQMPAHTHQAVGSSDLASLAGKLPGGNVWATNNSGVTPYATVSSGNLVPMNPQAAAISGGSAAHSNMQPYTVVNYCIALIGLYPPRP